MCDCIDLEHEGTSGWNVRWTDWIVVEPDTSAAHTDGDVLSEQLTFTNVTRCNGGTGRWLEVVLIETGDGTYPPEKPALDLVLYHADGYTSPAALAAQNAPFVAPSPSSIVARIPIDVADWSDLDANTAIAHLHTHRGDSLAGRELKTPADSTTLHGAVVVRDASQWQDPVQTISLQLRLMRD